jgi:FlaA1/EpsC-like NDP-sugar epimerase
MDITIKNLFPDREKTDTVENGARPEFQYSRTVVTGGAGSIGSAVVQKLLSETKCQVWVVDNDESRIHTLYESFDQESKKRLNFFVTDIRDSEGIHQKFDAINPDLIIHAAALKHVSILERQPRDAYFTNVIGTANIVSYLQKNSSISMIFISSDKAANPKNILGKTKYIGELMIGEQIHQDKTLGNSRHLAIVRFGNVFLSRGSVIETFIRQIKRDEPITITDPNMTRYFMDIDEAATLILGVTRQKISGITIFKMGEPIKIKELAVKLQEFLGASNREIEIIGIKDGEKIHEELFSAEEQEKLLDLGSILNSTRLSKVSSSLVNHVPKNDLEAKNFIDTVISKATTIQLL